MTIRIIIADDHSVARQGLRMFLGLDPDLSVVGEAVNGAEAVEMAEQLRTDVVLMDLIMPVMSGLEATAEIRRRGLPAQVIVVTSVIEEAAVTAVIRAGDIGYLLKDTGGDELRRAIKAAAAGRARLSPQIAARLLVETRSAGGPDTLTARENEVLRLAAEGLSDQEIALRLLVSEPVVHSHRRKAAAGESVAGAVARLRQPRPGLQGPGSADGLLREPGAADGARIAAGAVHPDEPAARRLPGGRGMGFRRHLRVSAGDRRRSV